MTTRDEAGSEGEEEIGQEDLLGYLLEALAAGLDPRELRKHGEAARRELALYALSLFESFQPGEIKVVSRTPGGAERDAPSWSCWLQISPFWSTRS